MRKIRNTKQDEYTLHPSSPGESAAIPFPTTEPTEANITAVAGNDRTLERLFALGAACHAAPPVVTVEAESFDAGVHARRALFPEDVRIKARETVLDSTLIASGVGLVPVPLMDVTAVTLVIARMLKNVSTLYGCRNTTWSKNAGLSLLAAAGSVGGGKLVASLMLRLIPVGGAFLAAASLSTSVGVVTYSLGMATVRYFESNGESTPPSFSTLVKDARSGRTEAERTVSSLTGRSSIRLKA
jgi:uncharacterized protein (DUF697 family)